MRNGIQLKIKTICAVVVLLVGVSFAAKAQIAIEGGLNESTLLLKSKGTKINTTFKRGANFGILADITFGGHVYFEPGYFTSNAGCKIVDKRTGTYEIGTIDIPLIIEYKSGTKCAPRFMYGAGIHLTYYKEDGLYDIDHVNNLRDTSHTLLVGSERESDIKKKTIQFGANIGYVLKRHLYVRAHAVFGLANIMNLGDDKNKIRPTSFSFNLGYTFSNCRKRTHKETFSTEKTNHWRGLRKSHWSTHQRWIRGA